MGKYTVFQFGDQHQGQLNIHMSNDATSWDCDSYEEALSHIPEGFKKDAKKGSTEHYTIRDNSTWKQTNFYKE